MYSTKFVKTQASVDYSTGDIQYIRSRCPIPSRGAAKEQFKTPIEYPGYFLIFRFLLQCNLTLQYQFTKYSEEYSCDSHSSLSPYLGP